MPPIYPPGTRKNNTFWIARITVGGKTKEVVLYTKDEGTARKRAAAVEAELKAGKERVPDGNLLTFEKAAELYIGFRNPSTFDRQCIERVVSIIGKTKVRELRPADIHDMAIKLYPTAAPATRNRNALRPAVTILHHAADAGLCDWIVVKKFKEPPPATRALAVESAAELIEAAGKMPARSRRRGEGAVESRLKAKRLQQARRRLVVWLFYQGTRISATLRVRWEDIDLRHETVIMDVRKGKAPRAKPLHKETVAELKKVPVNERIGPVFPWSNRASVRWLRRIDPDIKFTAHMARHTHGTILNAQGAGLRTIMDSLDHSDPKSSIRYQAVDVEIVRKATSKIRFRKA